MNPTNRLCPVSKHYFPTYTHVQAEGWTFSNLIRPQVESFADNDPGSEGYNKSVKSRLHTGAPSLQGLKHGSQGGGLGEFAWLS